MYQACMFDLDGTLANTLQSIAWCGNTALERAGLQPVPTEEYRFMVGNGADLLVERMIARSAGEARPALFRQVRRLYDGLYESDPLRLVTEYPGITALLCTLRENGVKTAVLSNKPDDMTRRVAEGLFGPELFTAVRGQRPGFPTKPDPTVPKLLLEQMEVPAHECLYIGDSNVDMETGRNAGMDTAGAVWGFRGADELEEAGAKYLVRSAEELEKIILR